MEASSPTCREVYNFYGDVSQHRNSRSAFGTYHWYNNLCRQAQSEKAEFRIGVRQPPRGREGRHTARQPLVSGARHVTVIKNKFERLNHSLSSQLDHFPCPRLKQIFTMPPRSCFDSESFASIDLDSTSCSSTTFDASPATSLTAKSDSSTSSSSSRRSVVFHQAADTIEFVMHFKEYSKEERGACWLNNKDMQAIKTNVKQVVDRMENNNNTNMDDLCTRGLEWRTKAGSKRHRRSKMAARDALIVEQEFMREDDCAIDSNVLAKLYASLTTKSQLEAQARAVQDAIDAQC
jgi:hypothetical protein